MEDLTRQYSIAAITRKLIGNISAIGDSQRDGEALENLSQLEFLLNDFIGALCNNVEIGRRSYEGSVQNIGDKSEKILHRLRDYI